MLNNLTLFGNMETILNTRLSLNFNVRETKAKATETIVYCVVRINDKQLKLSADMKVNAIYWDKHKQQCAVSVNMVESERQNSIQVNRKINAIKASYNDYFDYLCSCECVSTNEIENTLKTIVSQQRNNDMANYHAIPPKRTTTATTLLKKAFEIYYPIDSTKESTKKTNQSFLNAFLSYIKNANVGDTPKLLTQDGINDYQEYLLKNGKGANVINMYCGLICRLINDVLCVKSDFRKHKLSAVRYANIDDKRTKDDSKKRALTESEINAIINAENLTEKESEFRDLFIMQLNCGVRFSDLEKLFNGDYKTETNEGITTYIVNTQKEGITAAIIANETIVSLQKKYANGFKYVDFSDVAKYNKYLRKVAEKANLTQTEKYCVNKGGKKVEKQERFCDMISSHFARHTFITSMARKGYNKEEVSKMTGHADTEMISRIYEHLDDSDKAKQVAKAYKRISKQQQETSTENTNVNDALLIAQQAREKFIVEKEKFIVEKDNEINFVLKKVYMNNASFKMKNGDDFQDFSTIAFLEDFPTTEELNDIRNGANVIDVLNKRFSKHNAMINEDYKIIQ